MKLLFAASCLAALTILAASRSSNTIDVKYHLTARPWAPLEIPTGAYLDVVEGLCRFSIRHQSEDGTIIDPFLHTEIQYATPYFAYAVATLATAGRARDLLPSGIRAMEHATRQFARGGDAIPERHGEFFIPSLTESLELYQPLAPPAQWSVWRERMKNKRENVIKGSVNNWQTYAMKGEWLRQAAGLIPADEAQSFIERAWREHQRERIAAAPFFLFHDRTSDPDTLNVEAVGRGNLLALAALGYNGPSAPEIRRDAVEATRIALLLQDPSGQAPANGRTDDHVWVDVGYQLAFEVMAERAVAAGDSEAAGRHRRAALLAFQNIARWRRSDSVWAGSYYVTKNHFDPALRVGYQDASQYSNYNGSLMFHMSEAFHTRKSPIAEQPAPVEIGGYAFELDREFSSAFANAGGMQIQANLRGQIGASSGNYWTPLGIVRFGRSGWDTRLGPSDGALTADTGVSFAPEFEENGRWIRMAASSKRYEASWSVEFAHPALVRCALNYRPKAGESGPAFRDDLILTPDGVLSSVRRTSTAAGRWGITWPLLENDGRELRLGISGGIAETSYPRQGDRESFVAIGSDVRLDAAERPVRSTYGDLRPIRAVGEGGANRTFVYPHNAADPAATDVQKTFTVTDRGFHSVLGRVEGNVYVGRTIAGGEATQVDLDNDGKPDAVFNRSCGFLIQIRAGKAVAIETDRAVEAKVEGRILQLSPFRPVILSTRQ